MIDPILITGCARSGTSLTAGLIQHHGAFGGKLIGSHPTNPKGFFENSDIRQAVLKPTLRRLGCCERGQGRLPTWTQVESIIDYAPRMREEVEAVMTRQGYAGGPWFYKDAKICLLAALWIAAFPNAKWIIVRRSSAAIAASCLRTSFMRQFDKAAGWESWAEVHRALFDAMSVQDNCSPFFFWPDRVFAGDFDHAWQMINHAGLPANNIRIKDFIAPEFWHASPAA